MKVCIVGMGRTGSQIAFSLLLSKKPRLSLALVDINEGKLMAEFLDLSDASNLFSPIFMGASSTIDFVLDSDIFIITAGKARASSKEDFAIGENLKLVRSICEKIGRQKPIWIVTNPPAGIAETLSDEGFNCIPIGSELDFQRTLSGNEAHEIAGKIIDGKGFTSFGIAAEVLLRIKKM